MMGERSVEVERIDAVPELDVDGKEGKRKRWREMSEGN
jgi:hypothetical protein